MLAGIVFFWIMMVAFGTVTFGCPPSGVPKPLPPPVLQFPALPPAAMGVALLEPVPDQVYEPAAAGAVAPTLNITAAAGATPVELVI